MSESYHLMVNESGMKNPNPPGSTFSPTNYLYLFIRACLHIGGGPQVGEVPRLAVVVYIYT